ncbi:MarR family transcriptional regulator [Leuconostoc holzapfelii]|uniref:MarR family transcriptional regulator n=1 Tax=Leuconostoc holzapfelii TaxID=434464 RepID=A0ABT2NWH7_9LACO|nr:MarR family transcriptional regulator [Leuconostoc holzapfelii]MCT8388935.1 MarR family transcriptional regulator [Leuconostoc holzapfelii]
MTPADHLYDELCLSVYNTNRYFHRLYSRVLDPYDLSYLQYMSLLIIHQQGPLKLMAIGAALDLSSNTLTPVIDKLVKKSWLQKTPSPTDKRAKVLTIPADKQPLFAQILTEVDAIRDNLLARSGRPLEDVLRENQALNDILQTMLTEEKEG